MPALELAQRALWIVTTFAELAVVWMLLRKSLYRQFPCFFCYVSWQIVRDVFFAPLSFQHPVLYFYVYWYAEAASAILGTCVIFETYRQVLRDYESLRHIGGVLFRWACVLLLAG